MPIDSGLTRRQLLARAGGATAALLGTSAAARALAPASAQTATTGPSPVPAPAPAPPPAPMLKGISLTGDVNNYDDTLGVRPYLLGSQRPPDLVGFWVLWRVAQPFRPDPRTREQSWAQLSDPKGPAAGMWAALDGQIAQANADGRVASLTFYQDFPEWTHPSTGCMMPAMDPTLGGPGYPGQGRLPHDAHVPDDRGVDGPWAWFVEYCCARYANTGGEPTPGPGCGGATVGNPRGAHVDWLQPLNEPNLTWWPQTSELFPDGTIASVVAEMLRTAATVAARQRSAAATPRGPALLAPNTSDVLGPDADRSRGTPWHEFTESVLRQLVGWQPETPVGWAHHNYMDLKYGPQPSNGRWRVEELLDLLGVYGWPDPAVWLTEGGYTFGVRQEGPDGRYVVDPDKTASELQPDVFAEQVTQMKANWFAMAELPVRLWTQYQVNDRDVRFQSGLRGPVRDQPGGSRALNDPPYPAYATWPTIGA